MESVKKLFILLIGVIVGKMAELRDTLSKEISNVKDSLSQQVADLSKSVDNVVNYVDTKIPQAFDAISALSERVSSEVSSLSAAIENLNSALTEKINSLKSELTSYIQSEVADLVKKIGEDDGRLQELVDNVTALAQADKGLVSTAGRQEFDATQQGTARDNIGAASQQYVSEELANVNSRIDTLSNNAVDYDKLTEELREYINKEFESRGL
jgi:gas vesicle protein